MFTHHCQCKSLKLSSADSQFNKNNEPGKKVITLNVIHVNLRFSYRNSNINREEYIIYSLTFHIVLQNYLIVTYINTHIFNMKFG